MKKPVRFRRVFVPTDLSGLGNQALDLALGQCASGARLMLYHAVEPVFVAGFYGPEAAGVPVYDAALTRRRVKREQAALDKLAQGLPRAKALAQETDQAWRGICREAKRFKADLLVISTHGRSGLSKLLFGSVAQKVLAHYRGQVLILRPKGLRG